MRKVIIVFTLLLGMAIIAGCSSQAEMIKLKGVRALKRKQRCWSIFLITVMSIGVITGCADTKKPPQNQVKSPVESLVESTVGSVVQRPEAVKEFVYAAETKQDKNVLTLLDHGNVDLDKDGQEETIDLYTAAEKDPKGKIAWDDGQRWLLIVTDGGMKYVLFDNYVQLGSLNYWAYTSEEQSTPHISTLQNCTAGFIVTDYIFDSQNMRFEKKIVLQPSNVNMLHFSNYFIN